MNILGCAMFQAASYQPLTVQAQVWSHASLCGICDGQSGNGTFFLLILLFISIITIPRVLHHDCQFPIPIVRRDWIGWQCMLLHVWKALHSLLLFLLITLVTMYLCFTLIKKTAVEHWCHFQNKSYKNIITFDKNVTISTTMLNPHLFMENSISWFVCI